MRVRFLGMTGSYTVSEAVVAQTTAVDLADRLELRERLAAIVDELGMLDADLVDVPRTLAEGLLEEFDQSLAARGATRHREPRRSR